MDPLEVRRGFFDSIRRVDRTTYVRDEVPHITNEERARLLRRKISSRVVSAGDRHVLRRCI